MTINIIIGILVGLIIGVVGAVTVLKSILTQKTGVVLREAQETLKKATEDGELIKNTCYREYDKNGKPKRVTSCEYKYEYDKENRLIGKTYSNYQGKGKPSTIKYIYITK
jgi:uncharacterized protein YxeA